MVAYGVTTITATRTFHTKGVANKVSVFETLQLMLATETLIVVLLGLVVELIKLISKKK
ncbi:hypothetical protein LPAF129_06860 [Ligilactobacillus pabuli]|uniref:Holin-like toxin n=1 Tax=Ligilactobacillus pabuli TaxID=2886039 RepID=A0ABQ5JGN4_9LACO|nr:hypothetical protein LPAF129_06860 [Ligilactobacillus pabuli]